MRPQIETRQIISNSESKLFRLHDSPVLLRHLTQLVVTQQYSNPQLASIREIVSNAYDANLEAQKQDGVERQVDIKVMPDRVIIRDYGFGLSYDWMMDEYIGITNSTKHSDQDLIGAKGIGRLAPLAVSKQYFVTSYYNGVKFTYCVYLNENSEIAISLWDEAPSDAPSGIEVTIICPNGTKDKSWHIRQLIYDVYHVTEGSRHPINLDITACELTQKLIWLNDYYVTSAEGEGFTVDFYNRPKLNMNDRSNMYLDLGGALYPLESSYYAEKHYLEDHNAGNYKPKQYIGSTRFPPVTNRGLYGCLIVRVKPDYVVLNTSREEILDNHENKDKLEELLEKVNTAIKPVYAKYLQDKLQADYNKRYKDSENLRDKLRDLFLAALNLDDTAYLSVDCKINLDLGDGWTCTVDSSVLMRGANYIIVIDGNHISIEEGEFSCNDYYYLTYHHYLLDIRTDDYKWGANKVVPKRDSYRRSPAKLDIQSLIINQPAVVFCTDKYNPGLKKLEKYFNVELKQQPVVVVTEWTNEQFEMLHKMQPLINVLGVYEPIEPAVATKKETTKVMPEVSILLRQLRQSSWTRNGVEVEEDISDEITQALLQEKIIYFDRERPDRLISNVPTKYLSEYHELAVKLTDNATDRVASLVKEGQCNWVQATSIRRDIANALYNDYGYMVLYLGGDSNDKRRYARQKLLELLVYQGLDEYLPDLTRSLAGCSDQMLEVFNEVSGAFSYPRLKERTAELYSPYKGDYTCQFKDMLGPFLSPYYDYLISNYSSAGSQEQIFKDIALRLESEGADIHKPTT